MHIDSTYLYITTTTKTTTTTTTTTNTMSNVDALWVAYNKLQAVMNGGADPIHKFYIETLMNLIGDEPIEKKTNKEKKWWVKKRTIAKKIAVCKCVEKFDIESILKHNSLGSMFLELAVENKTT